jgi:hypothetical protein
LKFTRCKFENIGSGTGSTHIALDIAYTELGGEFPQVEVQNCIFQNNLGGYNIRLSPNCRNAWIHQNVFYNSYRGILLAHDHAATPSDRSEGNIIEYNIFHTTNAPSGVAGGYHFAYSTASEDPDSTLGNEFRYNALWNASVDPNNNGGIQVGVDEPTQGFSAHHNTEIDPLFQNAASGVFTTNEPAVEEQGLTTLYTRVGVGAGGTYPKTPILPTHWSLDGWVQYSTIASDMEIVIRKLDGSRFSCAEGDRIGVRLNFPSAAIASGNSTFSNYSLHVYFYDAGGNFIWNSFIKTMVPSSSNAWETGVAEAPDDAASFEIVVYAAVPQTGSVVTEYSIGIHRAMVVLNPPGDQVPTYFDGAVGGTWLGTAFASQSQQRSVTGIEEYDHYYSSSLEFPPEVYVQSSRVRTFTNSQSRLVLKDSPNIASFRGSINYIVGANPVRTTGYTFIILKWVNDHNYIYARVIYTSPAAIQIF